MHITVLVLAAVALVLAGFVLGNRFAELDLQLRERRLARQRRVLTEASEALRRRRDGSVGRVPLNASGGSERGHRRADADQVDPSERADMTPDTPRR
jgi:hypothetical protein